MRFDTLHLWYLGAPRTPRRVGTLRLVESGKGVSQRYGAAWLAQGFPLSEDLPLVDVNTWRKHFEACGVTQADIASLAERIDADELRLQRELFAPKAFTSAPVRKPRRRGPFQSG
jgi:hypothetical protein